MTNWKLVLRRNRVGDFAYIECLRCTARMISYKHCVVCREDIPINLIVERNLKNAKNKLGNKLGKI